MAMTGKKHTKMIALVAFPSVCRGSFLPFFSSTHIYSSCSACDIHTKRISNAIGGTSPFSGKTGGPGDFVI